MVQALQKELANFGKEKDKHIRNAQTKAKKAKADTEVSLPFSPTLLGPVPSTSFPHKLPVFQSPASSPALHNHHPVTGWCPQGWASVSHMMLSISPWQDSSPMSLPSDPQAAKAALKAAAATLAEALAERDAAGDERVSIEAQLQATLKSVAGNAIPYPASQTSPNCK